ncbi:hypothetical protein NDA11_005380 [Ustilago hordei]|uniref:Phospholipid scramblase n=1 Tax=Ustilago hordei TaxID=120017 RepID=I2FQF3_USTHO|nr:uncharacterized protein UHO2_06328 [Ustilago hordei]KAJ1038447.1 hypothetical protein NDA10_004657 [Ustilago hordei]KAJ1570336.1 hypothetical protein NDA15_001884 [Ustilago hordei]KAJ1571734.1 hypothetical protein NDA12_001166 [Ustilago hordei]KAJ1575990.1 hypothetical protein NDA11_005380 [Ustilago hordei]KAJ1604253.1 hypothetical protein NDA14_007287 [Ustilago hordei]
MARVRAAASIAERHLAQRSLSGPSQPARWASALPTAATRSITTTAPAQVLRTPKETRYGIHKAPRRPTPQLHTPHHDPPPAAPSHPAVASQSLPHEPTTKAPQQSATEASPPLQSSSNLPADASVKIPAVVPNEPRDVLQPCSFASATTLLSQSALVVTREIEMINIFLGFEQANKYSIHAPDGQLVGYLAEEEQGLLRGSLKRQLLRTHRPFRATVMDASGKPVLMIRRPFTWINSTAHIYAVRGDGPVGYGAPQDSDLELIGEVQQRWHLYKRRYELFLRRQGEEEGEVERMEQFAQIDAGLLSWTFLMQDAESKLVGAIDRNFRGFGREIFTDTGQYILRFDSVGETAMTDARLSAPESSTGQDKKTGIAEAMELVQSHGTRPLTLDERAVALATAVSIDFDYFSRHSEGMHGGGGMFPWFYMGGMGGGGGEPAPAPGPHGENVPAQPDVGGAAGDGGLGTGVAGGAIEQTPSQEQGGESPWWQQEQQQQEGDLWGTESSDPWAGADGTQKQNDGGFWGSWGSGGDSEGGGGGWGGFGGFFGGD